RQRAILEANPPLIGYLDDDVIPAFNWVATAYQYSQTYPKAGAYGGQIHGSFESPPPKDFERIESFLAIREGGESPRLYDPKNLILPPSAAWVIRKKAWLESVPSSPKLGGRANGSMVQGDDYEPLLYLAKSGWEIWYFPAMEVHHQISSQRLEREYLLSLSRGSGLCMCHLRMINTKGIQKPIMLFTTLLGGLYRSIKHGLRYRQSLKTDVVAACEMTFFLSWFISPIYYVFKTATTRLNQPMNFQKREQIATFTQQS
ncbi:MAG: hormogonium polysaccharide biosynthesis glycosyltransferase HpsE, partial [Chroococcales cyanobacterium]